VSWRGQTGLCWGTREEDFSQQEHIGYFERGREFIAFTISEE